MSSKEHLEQQQFAAARQVLQQIKQSGSVSNEALISVTNLKDLHTPSQHSTEKSAFLADLWDICYEVKHPMFPRAMYVFAVSFDQTNDTKRIMQLAEYMLTAKLHVPVFLQACYLMLYLVSKGPHSNLIDQFRSRMAQFIASDPSFSVTMMQHQGALDSMINKQQLDAAVEYLRCHASSLEVSVVEWNRVMVALGVAKRDDDVVSLYHHWISVMPPLDELTKRPNHKRIVPDAYTYSFLIGSPTCPITLDQVLAHLDLFGSPTASRLYDQLIMDAMIQKDNNAALMWWRDMIKRNTAVTQHILGHLVGIVRLLTQQPERIAEADQLAVDLWDECVEAKLDVRLGWYPTFLEAFDRQHDVKRIVQLVDMFMRQKNIFDFGPIYHIFAVLRKTKQIKKMDELKSWIKFKRRSRASSSSQRGTQGKPDDETSETTL